MEFVETIASHAPVGRLPDFVQPTHQFSYEVRVHVMRSLLGRLPENLIFEELAIAHALPDEQLQTEAIAPLLPRLPEATCFEIVEFYISSHNASAHLELLKAFAACGPESLLDQILTPIPKVDDLRQGEVVIELATHLPQGLLSKALIMVQHWDDKPWEGG
ncbi:hypothetical protein ACQ4M4_18100 [Leptolyngbya sp. AN02str]|uniref:hypothetical protein n=1 Tax=Leptolyngbya sp. AN02str TaxID=3423363 RepID=UPI003D321A3F